MIEDHGDEGPEPVPPASDPAPVRFIKGSYAAHTITRTMDGVDFVVKLLAQDAVSLFEAHMKGLARTRSDGLTLKPPPPADRLWLYNDYTVSIKAQHVVRLLTPSITSITPAALHPDKGEIARLMLEHWWRLAGAAEDHRGYPAARAVQVAGAALAAAFEVRNVIVHKGLDVSRDAVAEFAQTWLGWLPSVANVSAVSNALLQMPLEEYGSRSDAEMVADLRREAERQRLIWQPEYRRQINHAPVVSLDDPLQPQWQSAGTVTTFGSLAATASAEDVVLNDRINDPRLRYVLRRLGPDDLRVVLAQGATAGLSWLDAAEVAGMERSSGDRVRRKAQRLAAEYARRRCRSEA